MEPIKQYEEISLPKLNKSQKASINIATNIEKPDELVIIAFKGFNKKTLDLLGDKEKLRNNVIQNIDESLKDINIKDDTSGFVEYIKNLDSFNFIKNVDIDSIVTEYCLSEYCQFRFLPGSKKEVKRVVLPKGDYSQEKFYKELSIETMGIKELKI